MSETAPDTTEKPEGRLSVRVIAMPEHTNFHGSIFGGWLMSQMDLAGARHALYRSGGPVATIAVDSMTFHNPVHSGDEVSCYTQIERVGQTSITVVVDVWTRRLSNGEFLRVTQGRLTFVAVADGGGKRTIPEHCDYDGD